MPIALVRVDDRLVHGQVVLGWGRPLAVQWIALVDDAVAGAPWEAELYRLAMPGEMELLVLSVADAVARTAELAARPGKGIVLVGDIAALAALYRGAPATLRALNLGGVHHRAGRTQYLPYVYLDGEERALLSALAGEGAEITAQDVPTARAVPLAELA